MRGDVPANPADARTLLSALARGGDADFLRARPADRVSEQLEHDLIAAFEIPERALDVGLVKKNVAVRCADDAAALAEDELLDASFGQLTASAGFHRTGKMGRKM